jgi:hypothetical protein
MLDERGYLVRLHAATSMARWPCASNCSSEINEAGARSRLLVRLRDDQKRDATA